MKQSGDPRDGYYYSILIQMIDSYNPDSPPHIPSRDFEISLLPVHILDRNKQSRHLIFLYTFPHLSVIRKKTLNLCNSALAACSHLSHTEVFKKSQNANLLLFEHLTIT